jgi:pyruvate-formate lyase
MVPVYAGVLDVDPAIPSTITAFGPGYIDKPLEKIVGLQVGNEPMILCEVLQVR